MSISSYIEPIDHWIAFILLSAIGVNMIRESLSEGGEDEKRDYFSLKSLMTLGVATSIDALAIGISFALLPVKIVLAV
jgi:manganese efflux pump family protein